MLALIPGRCGFFLFTDSFAERRIRDAAAQAGEARRQVAGQAPAEKEFFGVGQRGAGAQDLLGQAREGGQAQLE